MNNKGYTFVELLVCILIFSVLLLIVVTTLFDNRPQTQKRAYSNAKEFVATYNIDAERITCMGTTDTDGYGTCAVTLRNGKRMMLQCPATFVDVVVFKTTMCTEMFQDIQVTQ